MNELVTLAAGLATVAAVMAAGLVISRRREELVVVDTLWGLGFVAVAAVSALLGSGSIWLRLLLAAMVAVWGLRLSWFLHRRNHGKGEDPRYADLASADGRSFAQVALKRVFLPQGIAMWLVATPVMVGVHNPSLTWIAAPGVLLWALGVFFEAVGDAQLAAFKSDPAHRGQVMDQGLWRYTRHPNYFGDACVWSGIWLTTASTWPAALTVISPIAMTIFLTKVTGASLNEKGMHATKPGYADYVRRTSGFLPLPPRS